ncbi:uncharacterized protein K460DRAFT_417615 [Cucurbitaria berberidis CBS 394.84]|uniref:Zn(2)-C6 fungal-type domain-containing protein n=1 Tax=Cucurbitaria berberidis CBS 394.84 TaxID=1168544 RepID=A0A9P4L8X1_9PLEO|nr:uncharacterized protein K460DRAFT_417615 [Cucurbitaria berberidis CBS 394.84]KAF1846561.1 hypothetical protein K460DRAFT_417615 [Cucurbitaria berberidis CBS 394.84]
MVESVSGQIPIVRPYRSHAIPACDYCKKRKIRCDIDLPGQPCRFCRTRQETCSYTQQEKMTGEASSAGGIEQNTDHRRGDGRAMYRMIEAWRPLQLVGMEKTYLYCNNTLAPIRPKHTAEGNPAAKLYNTISNAPGNPIVYLTVPRRRKGLNTAVDPGRTQRDIIEQILSPFAAEVRRLYFDRLHPCFPILDEKTFSDMWQKDNGRISSTLLCDLYASALSFWKCSELLQNYPRPDMHFTWNQAVAALQDDFMAPTISTVHAALLDMVGLHRDPTLWKATAHEKSVRIRLWWGVLIHDYWSSIGHGIPPTTDPRYYDVPIPTSDMLAMSLASETQRRATTSFINLCKLSQILGDILPFVYSLQLDVEEVSRSLRKTECVLDDWAIALPEYLRPYSSLSCTVNGASNLWFSYLSVKVLICRLAFKTTLKNSKPSISEARQYRLALLRDASCDVVDLSPL